MIPLTIYYLPLLRIRIHIGSAFDGFLDPDPHCECGSGSRSVKSAQKRRKTMSEDQTKNENKYFLYCIVFLLCPWAYMSSVITFT
jgi:hypothetical protein